MSKHKKTRKEKIIADYRHQIYILKDESAPSDNSTPVVAVNENFYFNTHILKDVIKTGILTTSIVIAELILFILLKNHAVKLPNLNY